MRDKIVTIIDIANQLGVSKSTVSRALRGHRDIHPQTREKILTLAQQLRYEPNVVAVNLKQQRTNTIGVIVPETLNQFFARTLGGIQQQAAQAGVS